MSSISLWIEAIQNHTGIGFINSLFTRPDSIVRKQLDNLVLLKPKEPLIALNFFVRVIAFAIIHHIKTPLKCLIDAISEVLLYFYYDKRFFKAGFKCGCALFYRGWFVFDVNICYTEEETKVDFIMERILRESWCSEK